MNMRRNLLAAIALCCSAGLCFAQAAFPQKPLKFIVPYPAGGITDQMARALAELIGEDLKQPVIIENRGGANGIIGATAAANAPADGYTFFFASNASIVNNGLLYKALPYDAKRDLKVIGMVAEVPLVLEVNESMPVASLREFVDYGKQRPGKLNYASPGIGNALHLAIEAINQRLGLAIAHIPYNGSRNAVNALLAGDVQVMVDVVGSSLPFIRSGKFKALAVTSAERLAVLPEVPTRKELGIQNVRASTWFGVAVPAKTPPDVVAKLQDAVTKAMADPKFKVTFSGQGMVMQPRRSLAEIDAFVEADRQAWGAVVKEKNIQLD